METIKAFETWLENYSKENNFFGAVQIYNKGELIVDKKLGYQNVKENKKIDENTVFKFYSISKTFCALAVMKLYEEGLIDLNAHPSKYLPYCKNLDSRLTLINLLQHTSGLKDIASVIELASTISIPVEEAIKNIENEPLKFKPGTVEDYNNTNYILLGKIVESVAKMPYPQYLESVVFKALDIKTAKCMYNDTKIDNLAQGYSLEDGKLVECGFANMTTMFSAGFLTGTIKDIQKLYEAERQLKFLKKETWQKFFTPSKIGRFACGLQVYVWNSELCYMSTGGHLGFRTLNRFLPKRDFNVIILSNTGFGDARADISNKAYELFVDKNVDYAFKVEMDKGFV